MNETPRKNQPQQKTPPKRRSILRPRTPSLKAIENLANDVFAESLYNTPKRRSTRIISPNKRYSSIEFNKNRPHSVKNNTHFINVDSTETETSESDNSEGKKSYSPSLHELKNLTIYEEEDPLLLSPKNTETKISKQSNRKNINLHDTSTESENSEQKYKNDKRSSYSCNRNKNRVSDLKSLENLNINEQVACVTPTRKSLRKRSPNKRYVTPQKQSSRKKKLTDYQEDCMVSDKSSDEDYVGYGDEKTSQLVELFSNDKIDSADGRNIYGFNTPKKRDSMLKLALNTSKTPKMLFTPKASISRNHTPDTAKRSKINVLDSKTPRRVRRQIKKEILKRIEHTDSADSDFSKDESEYEANSFNESNDEDNTTDDNSSVDSIEEVLIKPNKIQKRRRTIVIPILPKTQSKIFTMNRRHRRNKNNEFIPESDEYFITQSNKKSFTSNHTLDRLKNPRLPADRLFHLLSSMKLSVEHEKSISGLIEDYKNYFSKWLYILNEGFNILLYGLGSKKNLLHNFHCQMLSKDQTVLIVNGFFPSLTMKDILDGILIDILDLTSIPSNLHEAVDLLEDEMVLIPDIHIFLIVHNLDGTMLRNSKAQDILSRIANITNIHLIASIDHINTPLLWDHNKLAKYNFSWWDVTTMLPYTEETAFENSLLVQNSGELALSSLRSVFLSLTTNARGIYMILVKYQLKNKGNPNYQGMLFKDLYWECRDAFLVSSDLSLRAQLTEFLDHKLVKNKRNADGSESLQIPIESGLLQQFLEEQQDK